MKLKQKINHKTLPQPSDYETKASQNAAATFRL